MIRFILLYSSLIICLCNCVTIKTKLGVIKGTERKSRDGNTYYAFTSIPYAKPPLGNLRLKNPVPITEPWKEELDATNESPLCLQVRTYEFLLRNQTFGQEDCLYLSVYTPNLKPDEPLAVLVQTHGGGFHCGDGGPKDNADYLMDGNVILVNVHYRLGTLGFLSTEDEYITGNFGLKDQALALRWVKSNIKSFGGDDERITVFGESAGGASAHYHMMSPLSKDIIKGAISQSGWVNQFWAFSPPGTARPLAEKVADIVGCGGKQGAELLSCLQEVSPVKLIRAELDFLYWDFEPSVVFRPVQETKAEGSFITFNPLKRKTKLPWMTGFTSSEGAFKVGSLMAQGDSMTQQFLDNLDDYLYRLLSLDPSCPRAAETIDVIKGGYFPPPVTIKSALKGLKEFFTDAYMIFPMSGGLKRHQGPVFQYIYDYRAGSSITDLYGDLGDLGVCHADDLLTLFNMKEHFPKQNPDEEQVSRNMVKFWTNFAKYQRPTLDTDDIHWPELDSSGHYLHISSNLTIQNYLKGDVIEWWSSLPAFNKNIHLKTEL